MIDDNKYDNLPFALYKDHKSKSRNKWRKLGMKFSDEDFELYIYPEYIYATHCDICKQPFKNTKERQLDHDHKSGEVRNILCRGCNFKKGDTKLKKTSKSGLKYIRFNKKTNMYIFRINIGKRRQYIKSSTDRDFIIKFRDDYLKANNYNS